MIRHHPKKKLARLLAHAHWVGLLLYAKTPRILMYHAIVRDGSPYAQLAPEEFVEESVFARSMAYVKRYCSPLSLSELVLCIERGMEFPRNAVVVTFDDGYGNNWFRATPILNEYRIPATFFITTGYIDGAVSLWWATVDRYFVERRSMPEMNRCLGLPMQWTTHTAGAVLQAYNRILKEVESTVREKAVEALSISSPYNEDAKDALAPLTWEQLRTLSRMPGIAVAPHTVSHPNLAKLSEEQVEREIFESFHRLKEQGLNPAYYFAYPYGTFTARHIELLRKLSFECALTTHPGLVRNAVNLFRLPRYGGKNDVNKFICHASGLQFLLSSAKRIASGGEKMSNDDGTGLC